MTDFTILYRYRTLSWPDCIKFFWGGGTFPLFCIYNFIIRYQCTDEFIFALVNTNIWKYTACLLKLKIWRSYIICIREYYLHTIHVYHIIFSIYNTQISISCSCLTSSFCNYNSSVLSKKIHEQQPFVKWLNMIRTSAYRGKFLKERGVWAPRMIHNIIFIILTKVNHVSLLCHMILITSKVRGYKIYFFLFSRIYNI